MITVPVILAGGIGERFWPLSRSHRPKQLLPLVSSRTMLEDTLRRVLPLCRKNVSPLVVTGKAIAGLLKKILPPDLRYDCIVEPEGKNTAPAVALAAAWVEKKYGDAVMVVLSADHSIKPQRAFLSSMRTAVSFAHSNDALVVFGIKPTRAETGYGYLQSGRQAGAEEIYQVKKFIEKPSARKAARFFGRTGYYWNSGMFVWSTSAIRGEFVKYLPVLHGQVEAAAKSGFSKKGIERFYREAEKISIDYGIMEKSRKVYMVAAQFLWDDVGSFEALGRIHPQSATGVAVTGPQVHDFECTNSIIYNGSDMTIAAAGLNNMAVIVTGDAILIIDRSRLPAIKTYLTELKSRKNMPARLF